MTKTRAVLAVVFVLMMTAGAAAQTVIGSGTEVNPWFVGAEPNTGDVKAYISGTTLTIIGRPDGGVMKDYNNYNPGSYYYDPTPWHNVRETITNITFIDRPNHIGDYAFDGFTNLKTVTLNNFHVNGSIGNYAFASCVSLESISIPEGVATIGRGAFLDCEKLTSLNIYGGVKEIGESAFDGCASLTSLTIPGGVTTIEKQAFSGLTSLTSLTIPNSVTSIGDLAFWNLTSLTTLTIPNSVTSIGSRAFEGLTSLTSLTIPNSVTSIGERAFYGLRNLTTLTIPNGVTSIGESAFEGLTSLTSLVIPPSITTIEDGAFGNLSGLTSLTIPSSVTTIGNGAFYGLKSLTTLTIPNSVTSIGNSAFQGSISLTSLTISNSVTTIGDGAFHNLESLTSLTIPASVATIGANAFNGNENLETIVILKNTPPFTAIPASAFNATVQNNAILFVPQAALDFYKTLGFAAANVYGYTNPNPVVTFDARGGSFALTSQTLTIGDKIDISNVSAPVLANSGFGGWYADSELSELWDFNRFVTGNMTLYAKWTANAYTVTFDLQGGTLKPSESATRSAEHNSLVPQPSADYASRENYRFDGWFKEPSCVNPWSFANDRVTGDVTIYAKWTRRFTVTYDYGDVMSGMSETRVVDSGVVLGSSPTLLPVTLNPSVPSGYMFMGWWADAADNVEEHRWDFNAEAVWYDLTLTARMSLICRVTYDAKKGDAIDTIKTLGFGSPAPRIQDPVREGYLFRGWWDEAYENEWDFDNDLVLSPEVKLYAKWTREWQAGSSSSSSVTAILFNDVLTITGTGEMARYDSAEDVPWRGVSGEIKYVVIEDGVTSVGNFAFSGLGELLTVTISGSAAFIGRSAFEGCASLASISIPASVSVIEASAFVGTGLTSITINRADPPTMADGAFDSESKSSCTLYVQPLSITAYSHHERWGEFENVLPIGYISVLESDRVVPDVLVFEDASVVTPAGSAGIVFSAGPNPVARDGGVVRFYTTSKETTPPPSGAPLHRGELTSTAMVPIVSGTLTIFDATGNIVRKINVPSVPNVPRNDRPAIADWDLRDAKGRLVPAGTYLIRGTLIVNGKREKISQIIGIR